MPFPLPVPIDLAADERAQLEAWERRRTSAQALALRSRIVLAAAEGANNTEIARELGIAVSSVRKWRNRFAEHRLDGLSDEPRPGQPRKITDAKVEEVIVKTLETTPKDATHWSTRSMAAEVGLNQTAVHRIWKAFGLQPHRSGDVEALQGSAVHREGPRRGRAVSQPAGARGRALRRREVADSGAGPHRTDLADAPGRARARDTRLQALGHLQSLRRAGHHHRPGDRPLAQPPSRDRVQAVLADARPRGPSRTRRPHRARQQLNAQDAGNPEVAKPRTPGSRCTSPPPAARGSTSSSAGSPN